MTRTANSQRPIELLDAVLRYLLKHGVADLSLRPLAKAVDSSPRVLLYYFGSKEKMVDKALSQVRERQRAAYEEMGPSTFEPPSAGCREIWRHMTASKSEAGFRLFFETYSLALRHPRRFTDFLHNTIEDWLGAVAEAMCREGYSKSEARAFATVVLAGFRGFMLDYCASHDRERLDRAFDLWLQGLDAIPMRRRKSK